jgi:flavin-dependent dehydrogenase
VGADGVNSLVRKKLIGPFTREDLVIGVGKTFDGIPFNELHTIFLKEGGIGFVLPGFGFTQVVLGFRLPDALNLNSRLKKFITTLPKDCQIDAPTWSALQPSCITKDFFRHKCAGENFCLIGDAAGYSDPLNGEGIPFAILGATLAARAFLDGRLTDFDSMWREAYGVRFEKAAAKVRRAPSPMMRNLAGWAFSRSPSLIDAVTRGLSENHSMFSVAKTLFPKIPRVVGELVR